MVLNAKDQIEAIEYELFVALRNETSKYTVSLQKLADNISMVDFFI